MAADARDDDRACSRDAIQLISRGEASLLELVLVEAVSLDPAFGLAGVCGEPRQQIVDALAADKVRLAQKLSAIPEQVKARVDKPRRAGVAGEIDVRGLRSSKSVNRVVIPDDNDSRIPHRHRRGAR